LSAGATLAQHFDAAAWAEAAAVEARGEAAAELKGVRDALAAKTSEASALEEELRLVKQQQQQQQQHHNFDSRPMSSVGVIQALNMQVIAFLWL
jgi:hypothetical protein